MSIVLQKAVQKEVSKAGLTGLLEREAFKALVAHIDEQGGLSRLDLVGLVLRSCVRDGRDTKMLTKAQISAAIGQLQGEEECKEFVQVINAFDVPKISWDPVQRKFYNDNTPRSVLADAQAKQQLYLDRLHLVQQRLARNKMFAHVDIMRQADTSKNAQLTDLQSLKGMIGKPRYVLGCISRQADGKYTIEDLSAVIPLDLSKAATTAGFFTENCIVVAEGELHHDGVFHVAALGFPPTEPRSELSLAAQRLNFFGGTQLATDQVAEAELKDVIGSERRMIVLSNVFLDRHDVMKRLELLFEGFEQADDVPEIFVLMGDFHSKASYKPGEVDFAQLRNKFAELATLITQHPRITASSRIIIMPGPNDPTLGNILPIPPLAPFLVSPMTEALPLCMSCSNPCRIRHYSKTIVLFRHDVLRHMRRSAILPLHDESLSTSAKDLFGHLALTLLQQTHLCPLPLLQQPIYWQYDHALHLYPCPHVMVVADNSPQAEWEHEDCKAFNPGSFSDGYFASFVLSSCEVEKSEISPATNQPMDDD